MAHEPLASPDRFLDLGEFEFEDPVSLTQDELIAYWLSQSNTIIPSTEGRETQGETAAWLRQETEQWFDPPATRTFRFRSVGRCWRFGIQPFS